MYSWQDSDGRRWNRLDAALFGASAGLALVAYFALYPQIDAINRESPMLINAMFVPAAVIGAMYGIRITERAVMPSEARSPLRRSIVKIFLFFFVIGGMFSSVAFAMNGGSIVPKAGIFEDGLVEWALEYISVNGGATFLIITSITLMASATRRIVGIGGMANKTFAFVGTFTFFSMLALSFTQSDPTDSAVYLYTFYHAGVVGGALYQMNRLTRGANYWEDYLSGH